MSYFSKGLALSRPRRRRAPASAARRSRTGPAPSGVGVLVWTPSMVRSYLDETEANIRTTGREIQGWVLAESKKHPDRPAKYQHLWNAWGKFVTNWHKLYLKASGRFWGGYVDIERAHAFRLKLIRWRKVFENHGLRFVSAAPVVRIPGRDVLRDILIGAGGAVAAGAATYYAMKLIKKR